MQSVSSKMTEILPVLRTVEHSKAARKLRAWLLSAVCLCFAMGFTPAGAGQVSAVQPTLQNHPDQPQLFPNYAQQLTDAELKQHPDVLVLAFHAVIPGETINRVIAINPSLWEKFQWRPSDDIDTHTAVDAKTIVQVIPATHRMEVHMPLYTKSGAVIATFVCVWNFKDEREAPDLLRKSQQIRDEVTPHVEGVEQLLSKPL